VGDKRYNSFLYERIYHPGTMSIAIDAVGDIFLTVFFYLHSLKMTKYLINKHVWMVLMLVVVDGTFFSITNPNKGSSLMLIAGFLLVAATLYFIFNRLFKVISLYGFSKENRYRRFAFYFTGVLAGLLALQTIGELTLKDVIIFIPMTCILYFYLSYGRYKLDA
jgi:hypothetical protein